MQPKSYTQRRQDAGTPAADAHSAAPAEPATTAPAQDAAPACDAASAPCDAAPAAGGGD